MVARRHVRTFAALALCVLATACGFRPLYGENSAGSEGLPHIRVAVIEDRVGQLLRWDLMHRFGGSDDSESTYALSIRLTEQQTGTVLDVDDEATRANLALTAEYVLSRISDNALILNDLVHAVSSYNIVRSDFATLTAEQDARRRNVSQIAAQLQRDLAILFERAKTDPSVLEPVRPAAKDNETPLPAGRQGQRTPPAPLGIPDDRRNGSGLGLPSS